MSDDEYYYDSPYEDLTDILWDIDATPDLADELAGHSMHSPIWQDNPVEELRDYHSDWEYYSDDYYDDDPDTARKTTDQSIGGGREISKSGRRGKKRKIAEVHAEDPSPTTEANALAKCLRGTVWATDEPYATNKYRLGEQPKIALNLSNKVMHEAYNKKRGFGQAKLNRDESWANNLSLAAMGLQTQLSMSRQEVYDGDGEAGEEDEGDRVDLRATEYDDSNERAEPSFASGKAAREASKNERAKHEQELKSYEAAGAGEQSEIEAAGAPYKKRLKVPSTFVKEPVSSQVYHGTAPMLEASSVTNEQSKADKTESRTLRRSTKMHIKGAEPDNGTSDLHSRGRKRKAPPEAAATTSTTRSRAKKIALDSRDTKTR